MADNNIAPDLESNTHIRTSEIERTRGMKVVVRNPEGKWNLSCRSHLESFSLSEIRNPTSKWPKELAGESLPVRKWIGILGGIEERKDLQQIEMPENIENDALWRIKPVGVLEKLISACYLADTAARTRHWEENDGNPNPNSGKEKWLSPTYVDGVNDKPLTSGPSLGNYRAGRSERRGVESLRCGSPQDKLDEMARPLVGLDKTKVFLDHMASGTRVIYWGAWGQWREFCKQRNHGEWIDPREGGNWDGNFLEFLLFHLKVMNRKASTLKTK